MTTIKLQTKMVKPHFSITMKQEQKNLLDFILGEMDKVDITSLKLDPDFLKYLSELIENQVKKSSDSSVTKPSKMDILVEILKRLFPHITDQECDDCRRIVEFILKNRLVLKIPLSKVMKYYLKKRFSLGDL